MVLLILIVVVFKDFSKIIFCSTDLIDCMFYFASWKMLFFPKQSTCAPANNVGRRGLEEYLPRVSPRWNQLHLAKVLQYRCAAPVEPFSASLHFWPSRGMQKDQRVLWCRSDWYPVIGCADMRNFVHVFFVHNHSRCFWECFQWKATCT